MSGLPASHRDLLDAAGVGVLATVGPGGRPQATAVWYLLDTDGMLRLTVRCDRQKARNLRERPSATLLLVDPAAANRRTLEIRGTVELVPDEDYSFADRIGAKYHADIRRLDPSGARRLVVTLRPEHVTCRG